MASKGKGVFLSFQGFDDHRQEDVYFKFVVRAIELLQAEILVRRLGNISDFDNDLWEKKIVKIFKALKVMERQKMSEPHLSHAFSELGNFLGERRRLDTIMGRSINKSDVSRFSLADMSLMGFGDSFMHRDSVLTDQRANS